MRVKWHSVGTGGRKGLRVKESDGAEGIMGGDVLATNGGSTGGGGITDGHDITSDRVS